MSTIMKTLCRLSVIASFGNVFIGQAEADVTFDGTMGNSGALTGPDYLIEQSRGQRVGNNLFHSFGKFSINAGESATFTGDTDISNVVSRVTGGEQSIINGGLSVTIPNANLYLVNPAGIVFGEHASLDVGGAFHASTADYVVLDNGGRFDVTNPAQTVLSTGAPERYGFLSGDTGRINLSGAHLRQTGERALTLVSGGINIDASEISTQSGPLTLLAVGQSNEVTIREATTSATDVGHGGSITLSNLSVVGVGDTSSQPFSISQARAGALVIAADRLTVDHSNIVSMNRSQVDAGGVTLSAGDVTLSNGGVIASRTRAQGKAASISIHATGDVYATDRGVDAQGNSVVRRSGVFLYGNDKGGEIGLTAQNLTLDGASLRAQSGDITVDAARNITVRSLDYADTGWYPVELFNTQWTLLDAGTGSIAARNGRNGGTGNVSIKTNNLTIINNAIGTSEYVTTRPGNVRINATGTIRLDGGMIYADSRSGADMTAGGIDISAGHLIMGNYSYISASAYPHPPIIGVVDPVGSDSVIVGGDTASNAGAGSIRINARSIDITEKWNTPLTLEQYRIQEGMETAPEQIVAENYQRYLDYLNTDPASGIYASSRTQGGGGTIEINTEDLSLNGRAKVSTVVEGESGVGGAGNIDVVAKSLRISGRDVANQDTAAITASTTTNGYGGTITVRASEVAVSDGGRIEASTTSSGNGGAVNVNSQAVTLKDGGTISTSTTDAGAAGNITINASDLQINGKRAIGQTKPSGLFAETSGSGNGGTIYATAKRASITGGGHISTATYSPGNAGGVRVKADELFVRGESSAISSDSIGNGDAGQVSISGGTLRLDTKGTVTSTTSGVGQGGTVHVAMRKKVEIDGTGTSIGAEAHGDSDGGNVYVGAGIVELTNGAAITTSTTGAGDGGNLEIAGDDLVLRGSSVVRSNSSGTGDAGSIVIETEKSVRLADSAIETEASEAGGGNITIRTRDILDMDNSRISANVRGGLGAAGNIDIDPDVVRLRGSTITANAVHGDGGNVRIVAGVLVKDASSAIEASSEYGLDGDVIIDAPIIVASQGREDPHLLKNTSVKSRCRAARTGEGTLVVQPRMGNASHSAVFFGGMADLGIGRAVPVSSNGACSS